jgi:hypothetical protein
MGSCCGCLNTWLAGPSRQCLLHYGCIMHLGLDLAWIGVAGTQRESLSRGADGSVCCRCLPRLWRRFAGLWTPAHVALAMALDTYPALAWPLIHQQLVAAQAAFLAGDCYARRPADAGPGASAAGAIAAGAPVQFQQQLEPLLTRRFAEAAASGAPAATGGSTDSAVRLTHLLKALGGANNNVVESKARAWVPLFLAYTAASAIAEDSSAAAAAPAAAAAAEEEDEDEGEEEGPELREGATLGGSASGRAWRTGLREWLAVLGGLKGAKGIAQWEAVQVGPGSKAAEAGLVLGLFWKHLGFTPGCYCHACHSRNLLHGAEL